MTREDEYSRCIRTSWDCARSTTGWIRMRVLSSTSSACCRLVEPEEFRNPRRREFEFGCRLAERPRMKGLRRCSPARWAAFRRRCWKAAYWRWDRRLCAGDRNDCAIAPSRLRFRGEAPSRRQADNRGFPERRSRFAHDRIRTAQSRHHRAYDQLGARARPRTKFSRRWSRRRWGRCMPS